MPKRAYSTPGRPSKKVRYNGKFNRKRIPGNVNGGRRSIVPDSFDGNLPYVESLSSTAPVGGGAEVKVFTLNGMYDPYVTGVGHQPRGFDQYIGDENGAALYHHYLVKGAKVEVTWANLADEPVRVGMAIRDSSTTTTNVSDYLEAADGNYMILGKEGSGKEIGKSVMYWSGRKWFGKPNLDTERDLMGGPSGNPIEQAFLHMHVDNMFAGVTCLVKFTVKISYACGFKNPVTPAQS